MRYKRRLALAIGAPLLAAGMILVLLGGQGSSRQSMQVAVGGPTTVADQITKATASRREALTPKLAPRGTAPQKPPAHEPAPHEPAPQAATDPGAASSPTTASSGSLTASAENQVMATTWKTFSDALDEDDMATLATASTPDVAELIRGYFACGCQPWPAAASSVSFSAPPTTGYPRSFYADVTGHDYSGVPLYREAVFTQMSGSSPWLVSYIGAYVGGDALFGSPAVNVTRTPRSLPFAPSAIPATMSNFYQRIDQTGVAPALPAGFSLDGIASQGIEQSLQVVADRKASGYSDRFTHAVTSISPVYPGPDGSDIVCDAMTVADTVSPRPGEGIAQPSDQSQWGTQLAPGLYGSLTMTSLHDMCFVEFPDGSFRVVSDLGGTVSFTGTPAPTGAVAQPYVTTP